MTTTNMTPHQEDDFDRGVKNRRAVLGDAWVDKSAAGKNAFNADFLDLISRYAWGEIWTRPGLDRRTRSFLTIATLIGAGHENELAMHVRAALDGPPESRLTPDDIKEVITMAAIYCGVPAAIDSFRVTSEVFKEMNI